MEIKIRTYKEKDAIAVAKLIRDTYGKFNASEGSKKAVERYLGFYDTKNNLAGVINKFSQSNIFFVAEINGKIVGMARGDEKKLSNLFVKGSTHKKGVGRKLIEKYERAAIKKGSTKLKLNASMYAVPFYEKMGYKKSTGVRQRSGLQVQPMKKEL